VVLRVGGPDPRYLVVDYKTNRLGGYDEPLTLWHYRPEALERAMIEAHYPLQALLYAVALHRYLRWRQPGYDPDVHLGGVLYLFLRGMPGPGRLCADGSVPGVFGWRPPSGLVIEVSQLLAGGPR
jgi:exodeoxyribonuclease V beta subunit